MGGFVKVNGQDLAVDGRRIVLRGFGLGSWLNMEHFMTGLPGNDCQKRRVFADVYGEERAREFFEGYLSAYVAEADFAFLKSLGVNALRLSFTYRHFEDDQHPGEFRAEGFRHLDRVLALCRKYGIYALLDLHAAPGGQNPDSHADIDSGVSLFWEQKCFRDRVTGLWRYIAARYRDDPWVAGYDLLNEPVGVPSVEVFNDFIARTVEAIREVDRDHLIFLEGDRWAQDFSKLNAPQDPQIAYSFHYYPLFAPVGSLDPAAVTRKDIEAGLLPLIETLRERFHRPLWCGETGAGLGRDDSSRVETVLRHTLDILEENGVSWTLWAYKDAQAMGLVYPKDQTPWMRLARDIGWQPGRDRADAWAVFDFLQQELGYPEIPAQLRSALQFRLRGILQQLWIEQGLRPALAGIPWEAMWDYPASFLFANCECHQGLAELVKEYTARA